MMKTEIKIVSLAVAGILGDGLIWLWLYLLLTSKEIIRCRLRGREVIG